MANFDESKLPKWAQEDMESLRREIHRLERRIDMLVVDGPSAGPCITVSDHSGNKRSFPLDYSVTVTTTGDEWEGRLDVRFDRRNGKFVLHGSDRLVILPEVANAISVKVEG